jgi:hypothetical protein
MTPDEVVTILRSRVLRVRTGLWIMPNIFLGHEADEAVRLSVEAVDLRDVWLYKLPAETSYIGLTPENFLNTLDEITQKAGYSDCVMIYQMDLFLARLKQTERKTVWDGLFSSLPHRPRGLLITMPQTATELFPSDAQLILWDQEQRFARVNIVS